MRKAFYLLPVLILGTVLAGCPQPQKDIPVRPVAIVSPVPVAVVSPAATPSVVPVQIVPPASIPPPPPVAASAQDDSRAVAEYLAWVQQFDQAQEIQGDEQSKILFQRLQIYGQNGTSEENARPVREQQAIMRHTAAQDMTTFQSHTVPPACNAFAHSYSICLNDYVQLVQNDIINNPQSFSGADRTQDRKAASEELDKLFTAYPSVPRFSLR